MISHENDKAVRKNIEVVTIMTHKGASFYQYFPDE